MVKLCRRRCLGRVEVMCDKFDNRRYILKTGYQLETGLPVAVLTSLVLGIEYNAIFQTVLFTVQIFCVQFNLTIGKFFCVLVLAQMSLTE